MISKLYTKTGDFGETSLAGGKRVKKSDVRVEAYGVLDELNAALGAALPFVQDLRLKEAIEFLMHKVFNCASNLATPSDLDAKRTRITTDDVAYLERAIDWMVQETGPSKGFVLPTGAPATGMLHLARTVCRRAERRAAALAEREPPDAEVSAFINRASDFLFAAARLAQTQSGQRDILWDRDLNPPEIKKNI
jgi:cob(I)alamin adenosyltransferase